jgi:EmrB/QacA subfamily drug resistance transporter
MTVAQTDRTAAPDRRRWVALGLLCSAFFMTILDIAILTTALPSVQADLGFRAADLSWVVSAYGIPYGALLLGGRTADLLGRRTVFMTGAALFAGASLLAGLSWAPGVLLAGRALQGLGAALLAPAALAIIMATFPQGAERNRALGIWGAVGGLGGSAGLLLGGVLTDSVGWQWIFFVNVPVGLLVVALTPLFVTDSRDTSAARRFDLAGAATVTAALVLLTYAIVETSNDGWGSARTIGLLVAAGVLVAVFVAIEARSARPLLPLGIFRTGALAGANLVGLTAGMSTYSVFIVGTLYVQQVLGYSPLNAGLAFLTASLSAAVGSLGAQALVTRTGTRLIGAAGMGLLIVSLVLLRGIPVHGHYLWDLLPGLVIFGVGIGATWTVSTIGALEGVPERQAGVASGLINTAQQIGGSLGVAILTTIAVQRTTDLLAGGATPPAALTAGFQSGYTAALVFPAIGLLAALLLLKGARRAAAPSPAPHRRQETQPPVTQEAFEPRRPRVPHPTARE